jgi:hypothetical protein
VIVHAVLVTFSCASVLFNQAVLQACSDGCSTTTSYDRICSVYIYIRPLSTLLQLVHSRRQPLQVSSKFTQHRLAANCARDLPQPPAEHVMETLLVTSTAWHDTQPGPAAQMRRTGTPYIKNMETHPTEETPSDAQPEH